MGLFGNTTGVSEIELAKQQVHLSNDYLQALTPLIETMTVNEDIRQNILNDCLKLVEEIEKSTNMGTENVAIFTNAVNFLTNLTKYSQHMADSCAAIRKYYTTMGDKTDELFDQYKLKAKN